MYMSVSLFPTICFLNLSQSILTIPSPCVYVCQFISRRQFSQPCQGPLQQHPGPCVSIQLLLLASVDHWRSWICTAGTGFSRLSSTCCDCISPMESNSYCCSGCTCRPSLVGLLPGCSCTVLIFCLQLALVWSHPFWGRCQAFASVSAGHWQALPTCQCWCQAPSCPACGHFRS